MAQQALARPVIIPPSYEHKGEAWTDWLQKFNAACDVNGYAGPERLRFIAARLEGTAYQVYQTVVAANPGAGYPQLTTLLTQQFEPQQQEPLHEAEFRARRKLPTESQITFAAALRSLAERAFRGQAGPLFERMLLHQFIEGQVSAEIRLQLASNRPADMTAAIQRAVEIESAYRMESYRVSPVCLPSDHTAAVSSPVSAPPPSTPSASSSDSRELLQLLRRIDAKLDSLSLAPSRSADSPVSRGRGRGGSMRGGSHSRACYNCGGVGHFASHCPQSHSDHLPSQAGN